MNLKQVKCNFLTMMSKGYPFDDSIEAQFISDADRRYVLSSH